MAVAGEGRISLSVTHLGDGLLAYWPVREPTLAHVAQSLRDLRRLQDVGSPNFRVVIHHGRVLMGGIPSSGEESLAGPEVNFIFRQEKLAGELKQMRLASAAAAGQLGPLVPMTELGAHPLAGFEGRHVFHSF